MRRSSMRKSSMATRRSPCHDEGGASFVRGVSGGFTRGHVGVEDEIEQRREIGSGDEYHVWPLALEPTRRHGAAARGQVSEDDLDSARVHLLTHGALDVSGAHVPIGERDKRLA